MLTPLRLRLLLCCAAAWAAAIFLLVGLVLKLGRVLYDNSLDEPDECEPLLLFEDEDPLELSKDRAASFFDEDFFKLPTIDKFEAETEQGEKRTFETKGQDHVV